MMPKDRLKSEDYDELYEMMRAAQAAERGEE
jgi:hypothetical protein